MVQVARTIDKGKAALAGTLGEYQYDCPMDQHLFEFLRIDGKRCSDAIKKGDQAADAFLKPLIDEEEGRPKSRNSIANGSSTDLRRARIREKYFLDLRNQVAPNRSDVTAWADLLDLDEKRPVPQRVRA